MEIRQSLSLLHCSPESEVVGMNKLGKFVSGATLIGLLVFFTSCARVAIKPPEYPPSVLRKTITHAVAPGETVWRIAKMYDIETKDIMQANALKRAKELKMGQRLLIPDAAPLKAVIHLYPSRKWKYIIIHHSATDEGNALCFHSFHHQRGFVKGLGYHFVIDNGTKGKQDGHIEVAPRWIKQQDGAHCKASDMNRKAVGICLVGNFSEEPVSEKQMEALVYLVNRLREYYRIPVSNIMGHGQVPEAKTECPGKYFPWKKFKNRLKIVD